MQRIHGLDAAALALVTHDVVTLSDDELNRPTPCAGWTVADLIAHMNTEHEAISQTVLGPSDHHSGDLRIDFPVIAARWILALAQAGPTVMIPKAGATIATEQVHAVHLVDMLVHRWDLAKATCRNADIDTALADTALPIARTITAPSNPYGLVGRAYAPANPEHPNGKPIDNLAALLGREPHWTAPQPPTP